MLVRITGLHALALLVAASGFTGCGPGAAGGSGAPPPIQSSFDTDAAGWMIQGFDTDSMDFDLSSKNNANEQAPAIYDAVGGVTGGAAKREDTFFGRGEYFGAPQKFLGDLSNYYGGTLRFSIRESVDDAQPFAAPLVLLDAGGQQWRFDAPATASKSWIDYIVPLAADPGWTRTSDGTPASDVALRAALGNVQALFLRGEFSNSLDDSWLDNVMIEPR